MGCYRDKLRDSRIEVGIDSLEAVLVKLKAELFKGKEAIIKKYQ